MDKTFKKEWKEYLKNDEKQQYITNWEKLSTRFWSDILLSFFKNWREHLGEIKNIRKEKSFSISFHEKIYRPLLEEKSLSYIKNKTKKPLMWLYSKYLHFLNIYEIKKQEEIWKLMEEVEEMEQESEIIRQEWMLPIRKYEEDILSIDLECNILPPWHIPDLKNLPPEEKIWNTIKTDKKIDKKTDEKTDTRGYKIIEGKGWQLKIDFD